MRPPFSYPKVPEKEGPASIVEVMERTQKPTVSRRYWSVVPGEVVHATSGKTADTTGLVPPDIEPEVWNYTLFEVIKDTSMDIHRKTLRGPAEFIVVRNNYTQAIIESLVSYKPFLDEDVLPEEYQLIDATPIGTLNNELVVLASESIRGDEILVGRFGEGLEYKIQKEIMMAGAMIPQVEVQITNDPLLYKGEISHWGIIEILGLGIF